MIFRTSDCARHHFMQWKSIQLHKLVRFTTYGLFFNKLTYFLNKFYQVNSFLRCFFTCICTKQHRRAYFWIFITFEYFVYKKYKLVFFTSSTPFYSFLLRFSHFMIIKYKVLSLIYLIRIGPLQCLRLNKMTFWKKVCCLLNFKLF